MDFEQLLAGRVAREMASNAWWAEHGDGFLLIPLAILLLAFFAIRKLVKDDNASESWIPVAVFSTLIGILALVGFGSDWQTACERAAWDVSTWEAHIRGLLF